MPAPEIIHGVMELAAGLDARGTRALDVSCRNGEVLKALATRGFEVRGTRFERVLRPGGHLILTTPNIMRLDSRFGFMLSGMHKAKRRQIPLDTPIADAHHYHNYPIPFVLLYYLLRINGLQLEALGHGKVKPFSYVLYALFYPAVALDTRIRLVWRERKPRLRELNRELSRWMLDRRVLTEDNLIVRARKALAQEALAPRSSTATVPNESRFGP